MATVYSCLLRVAVAVLNFTREATTVTIGWVRYMKTIQVTPTLCVLVAVVLTSVISNPANVVTQSALYAAINASYRLMLGIVYIAQK